MSLPELPLLAVLPGTGGLTRGDPCDNRLTKSAHACHPRAIGKKVGLSPAILEAVRRKLGVAYRMLDVLVREPSLQRPGVVSRIGQRVTASVAQHVREIRSELGSNRPSTTFAD